MTMAAVQTATLRHEDSLTAEYEDATGVGCKEPGSWDRAEARARVDRQWPAPARK